MIFYYLIIMITNLIKIFFFLLIFFTSNVVNASQLFECSISKNLFLKEKLTIEKYPQLKKMKNQTHQILNDKINFIEIGLKTKNFAKGRKFYKWSYVDSNKPTNLIYTYVLNLTSLAFELEITSPTEGYLVSFVGDCNMFNNQNYSSIGSLGLTKWSNFEVCQSAINLNTYLFETSAEYSQFVNEAKRRGLRCSKEQMETMNKAQEINPSRLQLKVAQQKIEELEKRVLKNKIKELQSKSKTIIAKKPKSEFPLKPIPINFLSSSIKRDDIAVIIGNANYKKQGKDIPNVNPAYADAEGIKQYFMKAKGIKEGNIIYLKDATGSQLLGVFGNEKSHKGKLFNYIKPNKSNVYIYYAGHGAPGEEGDAYLVPTDTDSQTIEFTGYPLSTLYSNLGKLPAKSMTVILEACFSGGSQSGSLISKASPIIIQPKKTMIPENIKVIAAGSERQMASWEEDSSHSLFTKYFLKAMSGEGDSNKDGNVSDAELEEYLSDTMTYYARRYYGRDQKVQIHNGG